MDNGKIIRGLFGFASGIVYNAGKILNRSFGTDITVKNKGDIDLVTNSDYECERYIVHCILKKYPNHSVLTEEKYSKDNKSEFLWIIDPLDGTTNYSRRLPIFSISMALAIEGDIKFGIVYAPKLNLFFSAIKGKGAFENNKKIRVSSVSDIGKSFLVTGFPYDIRTTNFDNIDIFAALSKKALAIRRLGSASIDLCYVASGIFDCFWELKLNVWDFAAGFLILNEAGGKFTDIYGNEFNINNGITDSVVGSNSLIHNEILKIIKDYIPQSV